MSDLEKSQKIRNATSKVKTKNELNLVKKASLININVGNAGQEL